MLLRNVTPSKQCQPFAHKRGGGMIRSVPIAQLPGIGMPLTGDVVPVLTYAQSAMGVPTTCNCPLCLIHSPSPLLAAARGRLGDPDF